MSNKSITPDIKTALGVIERTCPELSMIEVRAINRVKIWVRDKEDTVLSAYKVKPSSERKLNHATF